METGKQGECNVRSSVTDRRTETGEISLLASASLAHWLAAYCVAHCANSFLLAVRGPWSAVDSPPGAIT